MARARRAATSKTSEKSSSGSDTLTCPECGKTFTRPASLGAHRNRTHGVVGASGRRAARRGRSGNGGTRRQGGAARTAPQQSTRTRSRSRSSDGAHHGGVNRDQLLQTLFPNGVPAREEVIRRAHAWLDEAEKLARVR